MASHYAMPPQRSKRIVLGRSVIVKNAFVDDKDRQRFLEGLAEEVEVTVLEV